MKYRIEITNKLKRPTGILLLDFCDDEAAIQFADEIAKEAKDRRIELWDEDRLVTVLQVPGSEDKTEAAN